MDSSRHGPGRGRRRRSNPQASDAGSNAARGAQMRPPNARAGLPPDREIRRGHRRRLRAANKSARATVRFEPPERRYLPMVTIAHLGPTNSGKTHAAIEALVLAGRGAYAAPLRLLAQEIHARLSQRLGAERVGLRTGEERINEHAPIIACTVELAPTKADVLVVDEVHWAADPERGQAWTRLLLNAQARELHLVGSTDALPLLRSAFADLHVRLYERFGPLHFIGPVRYDAVPPQTVVVAFSRKAVLALGREIGRRGRPVGVLYGAMPIHERRRQIGRFMASETEVLVATDVLGHGINLPCRRVLFAESQKYDGARFRALEPWEVAQIAGRAGRYGHHPEGAVGLLTGLGWTDPESEIIEAGLEPFDAGVEGVRSFRALRQAIIGPTLDELRGVPPIGWSRALVTWYRRASEALDDEHSWLSVADVAPLRARLNALGDEVLDRLGVDDAWAFVMAPVDADRQGAFLRRLGEAVAMDASLRAVLDYARKVERAELEDVETMAEQATILRWFTRRFPGAGGISSEVADQLEEEIAAVAGRKVDAATLNNSYGRCENCGRASTPWFRYCERCFSRLAYR